MVLTTKEMISEVLGFVTKTVVSFVDKGGGGCHWIHILLGCIDFVFTGEGHWLFGDYLVAGRAVWGVPESSRKSVIVQIFQGTVAPLNYEQ